MSIVDTNSNTEVAETKKSGFPFTIAYYMLKNVLPKCVLIHGGIVSSVYFQIAFNINNQEKAKSWQQLKCWKSCSRMATEIGCNVRKIKHTIKFLIDIDLIEESYHGKLKMFKLNNDKIFYEQELSNFLHNIDKKLLASVPKNKTKELRDQFVELNNLIESEEDHLRNLLMRMLIPDITNVRNFFIEAEQLYKGSSLFFMTILDEKIKSSKKNNDFLNTLDNIPVVKNALTIGCSQTTLNRYISSYQDSEVVKKLGEEVVIFLEKSKNQYNENKEGLVKKMSGSEFYCPVCDRDFENSRSLGMHLGKMQDEAHVKFNQLRKDKRCSHQNYAKLYEEHKSQFVSTIQTKVKEEVIVQRTNEYMKIPCECKMSCKECHVNWFEDFFKDCNHERRAAYIQEHEVEVETKQPRKKTVSKEVGFEEIPETKKTVNHGEDTAPGLLKYFYDLTKGKSPNWGKECGQIKTQMKKGLTPEEARTVLKYMFRRGQIDIRFFNTSVNDALMEQQYLGEMEQEGTAAYLLNYFYESHELKFNLQTLNREVQKIQETINSGLTYEETKMVLDYMIAQKCSTINFIANKRTEALSKFKNGGDVTSNKPQSGFRVNPSFFDQSEMVIIRDELAGARTSIKKIEEKNKEHAIEIAKQLFKDKKYSARYTSFEWAWRISLELDYDMYQMGLKEINKETYIDMALRNSEHITPEQLQTLQKLKVAFDNWLKKQQELFGKQNNITTV